MRGFFVPSLKPIMKAKQILMRDQEKWKVVVILNVSVLTSFIVKHFLVNMVKQQSWTFWNRGRRLSSSEANSGEQQWLYKFNFSETGLGFALELTLPEDQLYFQQVQLSCQGGELSSFSIYSDSQTLLPGTHLITVGFGEPLLPWCPSLVEPCTPKKSAPLL